ncbi:extracellular solute-binding protein [Pseudonocardia sp. MH-G8]|uniref:extracellular solute-binding protein n=1 Tax=Pseudonocardia sp. MH-G8 TaxID=1854588 RepID=UPI000BA0B741|nr:extracellular solute-binding protein [Pseudonocardia sp. MH-G8]OZM75875.1 ABC transporter substrate-binding protein [Pseudonocardia sp. MH-G8]
MRDLSRRRLLGLGAGSAAAALLPGCAAPGSTNVNRMETIPRASGPVRLTYWAWVKDLQKVADIWNAQNPAVQVEAVWIQGGNDGGYAKMYAALAAGGGPDIGQVELRQIPEYLLANGLVDLSRYGAHEFADRYSPSVWNQVVFDGGVYGIPQDSGPMAFYYQTALLDAVGGVPPATWDDWRELAGAIRETGPSNYLEVFPVSDASPFTAYAAQAGARWFRADGDEWVVHMTDDATLRVAEFFDSAIDDDLVETGFTAYSPGFYAAAGEGRIAAVTSASWGDALLESITDGEGKWRVAPMQTWPHGGFGSSAQGGSTAAVLAHSPHPQEALDFIVWMTSSREGIDAMIEHCGIGWSPSRDYIGEARRAPSAWFSGQSYNEEVFVPAAQQQPEWMWSPLTQAAMTAVEDQMRRKLSAGQPLVEGLALAEAATLTAFRNKGLTVRSAS